MRVISNDYRDHVTTIAAVCADGTALPPFFILSGKVNQKVNESTYYSQSGYLNACIWMNWVPFFIAKIPKIEDRKGRYILLLLDGFSCHVEDLEFLELLTKHRVRTLYHLMEKRKKRKKKEKSKEKREKERKEERKKEKEKEKSKEKKKKKKTCMHQN